MSRLPCLVPVLLIVVLLTAACGGSGGDETAAGASAPPAATGQAVTALAAEGAAGQRSGTGPGTESAAQGTLSTVDVVRRLTPSVVQITTEILAMGAFNEPVPGRGVGTGIVLDVLGNILTNNHVIAGVQSITVTLSNGGTFPAQVVGRDASTDTALIPIDAQRLQPASLGRSGDLLVGEDVIAVGHALGLPGGPTVSKGVVSALGRSIDVDARTTIVDLIQTDASINPGNSGGPLANTQGEVIGINSAGIAGSQGIGFVINIDDVRPVVAQLLERGYVDRGFLGISPANLTPNIANQVGVFVTEGMLVARVVPDSPAANAGLQGQDVIVRLSDEPIRNTGELSKFLITHPPGETVTEAFFRRS